MNVTLLAATSLQDFSEIAALAQKVWHATYDPLIGANQVNYMLEKFQSSSAIQTDVETNNYRYLMAKDGDTLLGYCGVKPEDTTSVFLSKVYVDPAFQGKGIAKKMVLHFVNEFRSLGYQRMHLTVNKGNKNAIGAYLKLGFVKSGELVTDIGCGYVMDDDTMELKL